MLTEILQYAHSPFFPLCVFLVSLILLIQQKLKGTELSRRLYGWYFEYLAVHAAGGGESLSAKRAKLIRDFMQVFITLTFAAASFWIILSHQFNPQEQHFGYTTLGTILGYWLKK